MTDATVTVAVHARPGASRVAVGGRHGDALVVAVTARAVDGAATDAVLGAVADALGVKRRQVELRRGATSRAKLVQITVGADDRARLDARLAELLGD